MPKRPSTDGGVLVVVSSNERRGAELEGVELARQLTHHGEPAECVALFARGDGPALDLEVLGASALGRRTLAALRRRSRGARIVVAYGSSTLPACAIALAGTGIPFVYRSIGDPAAWVRGPAHRARTALLHRRASAVVALWAGAAASLVELYRLAPSKVFVIPNARDADAFPVVTESSRDAARRQFGVAADSAVVGYIGALSSEKRPDLAVASVRQVSGAQLLVAGDGPLEPSIRAIAAHDRNVTMLGSLDDVVEMLHACDVILLTSRTEGMPGVLIEASMCGVRFVATAVGAVVELCEPPSSTVAVDSSADVIAHAVRTTMEPRAEPWDLARVARDRYDWQRVVPLWLDVLDRYG